MLRLHAKYGAAGSPPGSPPPAGSPPSAGSKRAPPPPPPARPTSIARQIGFRPVGASSTGKLASELTTAPDVAAVPASAPAPASVPLSAASSATAVPTDDVALDNDLKSYIKRIAKKHNYDISQTAVNALIAKNVAQVAKTTEAEVEKFVLEHLAVERSKALQEQAQQQSQAAALAQTRAQQAYTAEINQASAPAPASSQAPVIAPSQAPATAGPATNPPSRGMYYAPPHYRASGDADEDPPTEEDEPNSEDGTISENTRKKIKELIMEVFDLSKIKEKGLRETMYVEIIKYILLTKYHGITTLAEYPVFPDEVADHLHSLPPIRV